MSGNGPFLVVAACIVRGDQVLLSQRNQPTLPEAHLKWELPGGKVELGESLEAALKREIQEELGVAVKVIRLLPHVQTNIYRWPDGGISHAVILAYECKLLEVSSEPAPADSTVAGVQWVEQHGPWDRPMLPGTEEFIRNLESPLHSAMKD